MENIFHNVKMQKKKGDINSKPSWPIHSIICLEISNLAMTLERKIGFQSGLKILFLGEYVKKVKLTLQYWELHKISFLYCYE